MTAHDPKLPGRRSFWQWFGRPSEPDAASHTARPVADADASGLRAMRLEMQEPLLREIGEFLATYGLEIMPTTLQIAYDCVTGFSPRLAELIHQRSESGQPISLSWLEDTAREAGRAQEEAMLATLMSRLEDSLDEFGKATGGARSAAKEYGAALKQHVDDLEQVSQAGVVISELATLARAMMERTRSIESELSRSERRAKTLQKNLDEARRQADMDHLTGLPNRRSFEHLLDKEYAGAREAGEPLSIAFCDIDLFKRINDTHGHAAGDRVLKVVAETLAKISDDRCHVARHGGEEFAVLFRGLSLQDAWARLDAAREDIAERRLVNRATEVPFGRVSFSAGISDVFAYNSKGDAMKAADQALYQAKHEGRNRILIAGS